ncbi:MAG: hypothetical protein CMP48_03220 [Rickettsiales bacterium]|nr:hypothetical protein [Rickettsiales bacterium]
MTEIFTIEIIVASGLLGVSGLVMIASATMLRAPRDDRPEIDIDAVIRDAPYHLLHRIGITVTEPVQKA